jgi:cullin 1
MSMRIWQDLFFKETNRSLTQTCLDLIKDERDGKLIDSRLIRQVVQSYVSVGFIEAEKKNVNNRFLTPALTIYNDYFEQEFLEQTTRFYQLECNNFLANNSINDYLKKVRLTTFIFLRINNRIFS